MSEDGFTGLFEKARAGDSFAGNTIYELTFHRLRGIASSLLRRERPSHTLQPTALVSEVFLKLRRLEARVMGQDHFYRLAARAMGQVLIDHSRVRGKAKSSTIPLEVIPELLAAPNADLESAVAAREAFSKLRAVDPRTAETVWLRVVEGFTITEVSRRQQRDSWRVRADCDFGVEWLSRQLSRGGRSFQ